MSFKSALAILLALGVHPSLAFAECAKTWADAANLVKKKEFCPNADLTALSPADTTIEGYKVRLTINERGNKPNLKTDVKIAGITMLTGDVPVIICESGGRLSATLRRTQATQKRLRRADRVFNLSCSGKGLTMSGDGETYIFK